MKFSGRMLLACGAVAMSAAGVAQTVSLIVKQDRQFYTQGSYAAFASPWSTTTMKALVQGRDYADTITISPPTFPANTVIRSRWPTTLPATGVWGYNFLTFGNYDGGQVRRPITPRRVDDIAVLSENFSYSYNGSANFNLLNEFYLTAAAGQASQKVIEIGFFPHAPAVTRSYFDSARLIGDFTDQSGRLWRVRKFGTFVMFMPRYGGDVLVGTLDMRAALQWLKAKSLITGREWFNGAAFGSEPVAGAGYTTLNINYWYVSYR